MRKAKQIFQGAVDVFAEKGFDRATMDEVAERSGVAKGTLYYHFGGKEDLIRFLMEEGVGQLTEHVEQARNQSADPVEQLRRAIEAQIVFFDQNREFCQLLLKGVWSTSDRQIQFREIMQKYFNQLQEIIDAGIAHKQLRAMPAEWAAVSLFGMVSIVSLRVILQGRPIDRKELTEFLFQQYLYGASLPEEKQGTC
ncbi:TetR/AcrR family transcriptional regulator [Heliobacterium chlorum]|uniref:TetR/AcrR family transcriptional regulator n=1 Tax=Heliobacterium chlorum TaxID=2698 RepID=A0ABR7T6U4_HELCL|nr:TetR/AcrR family transcriptional regulator [Heliobacterium chlorum]